MIRHKLSSAIITSLITFASGFSAAQENLCEDREEVIWSCSSAIKVYSLCGSEHVKDEPGYLKYRAGTTKETEFVYPDSSQAPRDVFKYRLLNTTAVVEFENGGYRYSIYESINGEATIEVDKDGKTVANIECDSSTDTLTLTHLSSNSRQWEYINRREDISYWLSQLEITRQSFPVGEREYRKPFQGVAFRFRKI